MTSELMSQRIKNALDYRQIKEYEDFRKGIAIVLLKTIREPTQEMLNAGYYDLVNGDVYEAWQSMIDVILKEIEK